MGPSANCSSSAIFKFIDVQIHRMMERYIINQTTLELLALFRSDYRKSYYLREAAREIDVDMKAVQHQLKRLEAMNIVSSAERGKIKEYRLNLTNSVTRFFMTMAETFYTITFLAENFLVKKLFGQIEGRAEGSLVLFGSLAKGQATRDSDVDLFIISDRKTDTDPFKEAEDLRGRRISTRVASAKQFLKGLQEDDPLMKEVVSNHVILKGVDEFCEIMWRRYARE